MPSRSCANGRAHRLLGLGHAQAVDVRLVCRRRRWEREAEDRGQEVQPGDDQDHGLGRGDVHDERAKEREPEGERRVQCQREDPVGRQQLVPGDDVRDHRGLGRREEHRHRRDEHVQDEDQSEVAPREPEGDECEAAQDVGRDQDVRPSIRST